MIREELLRHTVTITTPADTVDGYGNPHRNYTAPPATERVVKGWVEQRTTDEPLTASGDRLISSWLLVTNEPLDGHDRVGWEGDLYAIDGAPSPMYDRAGVHHYEAVLKLVEG